MRKPILYLAGFALLIFIGSTPYLNQESNFWQYLASTFFPVTITQEKVVEEYNQGNLKVLIIPGHNNYSPGAVYRDVREEDLTNQLGHELKSLLDNEDNITTTITRDENGEYYQWFSQFLYYNKDQIEDFRQASIERFKEAKDMGGVEYVDSGVGHNYASSDASLELYGINSLANNYGYNLVIHIHFNDHSGRKINSIGDYEGFAVYVPESQLPNGLASKALGEKIVNRLSEFIPKSSLPQESKGLIESQDLIAIGSNASRKGVSLLVEYSYIYEPQLRTQDLRDVFIKEMAYQTYLGIKDYVSLNWNNEFQIEGVSDDVATLPYIWKSNLKDGQRSNKDVYALQVALKKEGLYPPAGKSYDTCPISGNFGKCTESAVIGFQDKYRESVLEPINLREGTGYFGSLTRQKLNEIYGQ